MRCRGLVLVLLTLALPFPCLTSCPPCKMVQSCRTSASTTGSFLLAEEISVHCPVSQGFTGCLYRKNGTSEFFCFKSGPTEECSAISSEDCTWNEGTPGTTISLPMDFDFDVDIDPDIDIDPEGTTVSVETIDLDLDIDIDLNLKLPTTSCPDQFPSLSLMSDSEVAGLCCEQTDCQTNAGCFLDELSPFFKTSCHCYLGYTLDITSPDVSLPKTGSCMAMSSLDCSTSESCYSDSTGYTICPYCSVTKVGEGLLGTYVGGTGDFLEDDTMEFTGSTASCPALSDYTGMFWYCWYDALDEVVDVSQTYLMVEEVEPCTRFAYVYTPLACDYAKQE